METEIHNQPRIGREFMFKNKMCRVIGHLQAAFKYEYTDGDTDDINGDMYITFIYWDKNFHKLTNTLR